MLQGNPALGITLFILCNIAGTKKKKNRRKREKIGNFLEEQDVFYNALRFFKS